MDTVRILEDLNADHTNAEVLRTVLREAIQRHREVTGYQERSLLRQRIRRLERRLGI